MTSYPKSTQASCGRFRSVAVAVVIGMIIPILAGCQHPTASNAKDTAVNFALLPLLWPYMMYFHESPIVDNPPIKHLWALKLSPDGRYLAATKDGRVAVLTIGAEHWEDVPMSGLGGVDLVAFSPRGKEIAILTPCLFLCGRAGASARIVIVGLSPNRPQKQILLPPEISVREMVYSPDGGRIALTVACLKNCQPGPSGSRIAILDVATDAGNGSTVPAVLRYPMEIPLPPDVDHADRSGPLFRSDGKVLLYHIFELFKTPVWRQPVNEVAIADLANPDNLRERILVQRDGRSGAAGFTGDGDLLIVDRGVDSPGSNHYSLLSTDGTIPPRDEDRINALKPDLLRCAATCDKMIFVSKGPEGPQLFFANSGTVQQITHFKMSSGYIPVLGFSADGQTALIGVNAGNPFLIDIATGRTTAVPIVDLEPFEE